MLSVINPVTQEVLSELSTDTPSSISTHFQNAKKAQKNWQQVPMERRCQMIRNFGERLLANREELAKILTAEMGKPIAQSRREIESIPAKLDFFIRNVDKAIQELKFNTPAGTPEEFIRFEPLGVVANISAWNYPYGVGVNVFVPALLTGNTVLYKPSEFASLTGLQIAKLMHEAGIPTDVFIPVIGGKEVGQALLEQNINAVFFTGSYAAGKAVAAQVAGRLIKTQFELGGKDPTYVANDADIQESAVSLADGAFYNAGQSCCSVERLYVHESIYEPFVDAFVKEVESYKVGDPLDSQTYLGPLTREAQLAVLEDQVQDAREKGAQVLLGGKRLPQKGFYFAPTVIAHTNHSMKVMRDESFGPIVGIQKVRSDDEALELMNDTEYGLTAGVYSRSPERAERVLSQANTGTVFWNCCDRVSSQLPWTGRNHSGLGSTSSLEGIKAFLQPKAWHWKTLS